jgi:hypothetical protein
MSVACFEVLFVSYIAKATVSIALSTYDRSIYKQRCRHDQSLRSPTARQIEAEVSAARNKVTLFNKMRCDGTLSRHELDYLIAAAKIDSDMRKMQLIDSFIMQASLSNCLPRQEGIPLEDTRLDMEHISRIKEEKMLEEAAMCYLFSIGYLNRCEKNELLLAITEKFERHKRHRIDAVLPKKKEKEVEFRAEIPSAPAFKCI